jgi:hypothetical protein
MKRTLILGVACLAAALAGCCRPWGGGWCGGYAPYGATYAPQNYGGQVPYQQNCMPVPCACY